MVIFGTRGKKSWPPLRYTDDFDCYSTCVSNTNFFYIRLQGLSGVHAQRDQLIVEPLPMRVGRRRRKRNAGHQPHAARAKYTGTCIHTRYTADRVSSYPTRPDPTKPNQTQPNRRRTNRLRRTRERCCTEESLGSSWPRRQVSHPGVAGVPEVPDAPPCRIRPNPTEPNRAPGMRVFAAASAGVP